MQPLLAGIFCIPERRIRLDREEMRELFFDATERPTRRPEAGQRAYYSGKRANCGWHVAEDLVVPPKVIVDPENWTTG